MRAPRPVFSSRQSGLRAPETSIAFIVSTSFDMDPRACKVAESLARAGFPLTVIAWDRGSWRTCRISRNGIPLLRFGIPSPIGRGFLQLPAMLLFWLRVVLHLVRRRYSIVHCNRFDTLVPALIAGLVRRTPIVYDLHIPYADRLRTHDHQPGMRLVRRSVSALEGFALRRVTAHAFTDSPAFTRELQRRGGGPVSTLLNVPPMEFAADLPPVLPRPGQLVFGRIGAFTPQLGQGVDDLLYVLGRLRATEPSLDVRLLCVGNFVPPAYLAEVRLRAARTPGCIIQEYVPHHEVPAWYARLDVAVVNYDVSAGARYIHFASAQKLFEAMACGVPVVLLANEYMETLVRELACGIVPARRDREGLFEACRRLARDPDLRARLGAAGRRAFLDRYHWQQEERELLRTYHEIAHPGPSAANRTQAIRPPDALDQSPAAR